jgi:DnaJ-class molecular chaperone
MPLSQYPGLRGDLILTFDTQFPPKLSPESKRLIKHALSL